MNVLVIEDSDVDFLLVERALGDGFTLRRTFTLADGLGIAREGNFDLVILDLSLPDSRGYETFGKARAALPNLPIVILSGLDDGELALRAVSNGAQDFVRKSRLLDYPLDRTARYAIERSRSEESVRRHERRNHSLLENLPTAVFQCDAQGLITFFNRKAAEIWGREPKLNDPADRFSGSWKLYSVDGAPEGHDQSWMARTLRERRSFNGCEMIIEQPNGGRRTAMVHTNPVLDDNGTLGGAIMVLVDITQQRQAEQRLRESERFARSTVNSLATHIAILDETGTILAVNTAWQRFGAENGLCVPNGGLGLNYLDVCDCAAAAGDEVARANALGIRSVIRKEQLFFEQEYPCHSPDKEQWFLMRATPFEGEGPTRVVITHENITARKTAERLASEQCGLHEAVAGMEQVLGVVGHELRTPLAAVRAISEFLTMDGAISGPQTNQFLHSINEQVNRMSDTVNNLLEAARLNSGRAKWNWEDVDLNEVIADAVASVRPLADGKSVRIQIEVRDQSDLIRGDADALRRLTLNLLSNACKHTTDGQIAVHARCFSDEHGAWAEVVVTDTGCGIPPELIARLGEAFALNSGVVGANHVTGTGLGLAICKGIAAAHGGLIDIQSVLGTGTTATARFRADLPAAATGDTEYANDLEGVGI